MGHVCALFPIILKPLSAQNCNILPSHASTHPTSPHILGHLINIFIKKRMVWWILPGIRPTMRKSSDHDVLADITNLCIAEYKVVLPPSTCLQFNFNNSLVWDLVLGLNCQNLFRGAKLSFRNKDLSGTNKTFTGIRFAQDRNHNVLDMRFLIKSLCWW